MKTVQDVDMKALSSRDIALVGFDGETGTLEVVFRAGGVYRYQDVPETVYQSFMTASSHGTFFQQNIKNQYSYVKVR
jgi:hypothetical protein